MLHSVLVLLSSTNDGVISNSIGRPAQSWFLNRLVTIKEFLEIVISINLVPDEEQLKVSKILKIIDEIHNTGGQELDEEKDNSKNLDPTFLSYLEDIHVAENNIRDALKPVFFEASEKASNLFSFLEGIHKSENGIRREYNSRNNKKLLRPYTASMLLFRTGDLVPSGHFIKAGEKYMLRFTTLSPLLSEVAEYWIFKEVPMIEKIFPLMAKTIKNTKSLKLESYPSAIRLYKLFFTIERYVINENKKASWGNSTSFSHFAQDKSYNDVTNTMKIEFNSPTSFRRDGDDNILPDPGLIFKNLWGKWNEHCPMDSIDISWPAFAKDCIVIESLRDISTEKWSIADGTHGYVKGFRGEIEFRLLPKEKVNTQWKSSWDGAKALMHLLGRFAYYCGVGHHTTIGMGQARIVPNSRLDRIAKKVSIPARLRK